MVKHSWPSNEFHIFRPEIAVNRRIIIIYYTILLTLSTNFIEIKNFIDTVEHNVLEL